ncbi:MAG TPA: SDR family NAD(P)-dependent oxidoreductase [Bradyrhizobium sp.]|uniref:NAD-dependent epimerase/dehydratase family protein n=1 Tax=Bradyrhizobium sp. TaxID=376 RepID=UPI002C77BD15|nr:SDR family NAD(P)-dependent oxidoreductase [Bradyrhizobium sp.]HLZ03972.1 SDR family NAD(P)-dependent oxidoreductase [Bradyrhizobium sp.]
MSGGRVVAVTGATGFLGRHLVRALAREGAHVRILARRDAEHELWNGIALDVVPGSLEDVHTLERLAAGADAIVHAAGLVKARDRAAFLRTNGDGTRAMAAAARRRAPGARFIAISSLAAREPQLSDYAASKRAGEQAAREAFGDAPDRLVIVRPPAIYGPWDRETLAIFKAASQAIVPVFGSGRAAIVHVADAADAIARLAMGIGDARLYALADTNPDGYTISQLLSEASRAIGSRPRFMRIPAGVLLTAGTASGWWGRIRGQTPIFTAGKAREMLHPDWSVAPGEMLPQAIHQPKISIAEGFRETAAWYKAAGWLR